MIINDLKIDNDNNIIIKNGDFVISDSASEHAYSLLSLNRGDLKLTPKIGCDLIYELNSKISIFLKDKLYNKIKKTFKEDGYDTFNLQFDIDNVNNTIQLHSKAKRIRL